MKRTYVKNLKDKIGEKVLIKGFVQAIRDQGGIKFIILRDITGAIQIVILKSEKEAFDLINKITLESVVEVRGLVKEEKQAPAGFEVQAEEIKILSEAFPELPIPVLEEKSGEPTDITKRLDWRWIDLRKEKNVLVMKTWAALEEGVREYFKDNDYIQIYTPVFMSTASESGADVFRVDYFEGNAYLAQSPQFYKQMAMASGLEKVFTFGPVFRAEPSFTSRHMTEFTGWDVEISYIESHHDIMDEIENILVSGIENLNDKLKLNIPIPSRPFPRIPLIEAKKILAEAGIKSKKDYDISAEEEEALAKIVKEKEGTDFVFITDWPVEARPFYHMRYEDNQNLTKSADLIYKGLEVTTLAQREHRYDVLVEQAKDKDMDIKSLENYLNFFKYGCPPHGGFGFGPARFIYKLLDLQNVKEATFLPRDVKRIFP